MKFYHIKERASISRDNRAVFCVDSAVFDGYSEVGKNKKILYEADSAASKFLFERCQSATAYRNADAASKSSLIGLPVGAGNDCGNAVKRYQI